jgi:DNA-binding response OmpR family regulator
MSDLPASATHVLVVEDEENLRRTFVRSLAQRGYRTSEARTVAWAVDVCLGDRPDVIVLDVNLPDGSGWDVLRAMADRGIVPPSVVAISAVPPRQTRLSEFHPADVLLKPFAIDVLLRAVARAAPGGVESDERVDRSAV